MARFVVLLSVLLAAVASVGRAQSFFDTPCTTRIRRDWRWLSAGEKQLYRDAIKAAMTSGHHTLFQEVLSDKDTCNEVYLTGASVYWHRRFLLAYENMLRSLEPRFACITIPYWDMFADYASQVATPMLCGSMEQCSPFLGEFGGSNGSAVNVAINGLSISTLNPAGNCVDGLLSRGRNATESSLNFADYSSFCQSSAANTSCSSCVPRGTWNTTMLPSSLTYSTLTTLIRSSAGFISFGGSLMRGVQASMHNALNATMATCATAADPMFYNLQATFDLVHQMYYDCQIGRNLTTAEKQATSSRFVYQQFAMAPGVAVPTVMSNMTTYWNSTVTGQRMRAEDHPTLRQFFDPLPNQYWFYASAADLGANNSYSYGTNTVFNLLQLANVTQCPQNRTRRLQEVVADEAPGTVEPDAGDGLVSDLASTEAPFEIESVGVVSSGPDLTPTLPEETAEAPVTDGLVLATTTLDDDASNKATVKMFNVFQEMMAMASNNTDSDMEALDVNEMAECVIYDERFSVDKFSDYFRSSMGYPSTLDTVCAKRLSVFKQSSESDKEVVEDLEAVYRLAATVTDEALADLANTSNATAVVPITELKTETTTEMIQAVASGEVLITVAAASTGVSDVGYVAPTTTTDRLRRTDWRTRTTTFHSYT